MEELEELLLTADLGVSATNKIMQSFAIKKQDKEISDVEVRRLLAADIEDILRPCEQEFTLKANEKPAVILMVGVNGAGKTTTIGKLASKLKEQGKQVSFIAGDTFRAAAIEQLKVWAQRLDIRIFFRSRWL